MQRLLWIVFVVACGSSSGGDAMPDGGAGMTGGGQHVTQCSGVVQSGSASNCPYGDCNDTGGDRCTKYASWVPGNASGLCTAGATGTYGLAFQDGTGRSFYEVIQCTNGSPTQHACTGGFSTVVSGYDGNPGYKCL